MWKTTLCMCHTEILNKLQAKTLTAAKSARYWGCVTLSSLNVSEWEKIE